MDAAAAYARLLETAGRKAIPVLARDLRVSRRAAAEAFGAAGGLVLAGLARHRKRRAADPEAARAVLEKYGRPADVDAADLAVAGHLARPDLDPRLGGLLGDTADRAATWLATRTGARPEFLARAVAASAPIALGALRRAAADADLPAFLDGVSPEPLEAPERLLDGGPAAEAYRGGRRSGAGVLDRVFGRWSGGGSRVASGVL